MFITAAICSASDALLILFGIFGFGAILLNFPDLITVFTWGGAIFVFFYGILSFRSSYSPNSLRRNRADHDLSLRNTVLTTLAFTWLNPHVYLDTVVLLGSVAIQFEDVNRLMFAVGAISASIIWFFGLGYGASRLASLFVRTIIWRILDLIIGIIMWFCLFY